MVKTTLKIDGMMCSMCEAHINDCIRNSFEVKKVSSSHIKNETVIISPAGLDRADLKAAVDKTGYTVVSLKSEPYEKKSLLSLFKK